MSEHTGPRVLLLGATGLLGSYLARELPGRFVTWIPAPRDARRADLSSVRHLSVALEATDRASLEAVLAESEPDVVVNCLGVTPTSPLAQDRLTVVAVNSLFPHLLASRLRVGGRRLIHISTDAVFSGVKGRYREGDAPDPIDFYGRSKLLGEVEGPGCLTVRTSFFGRSPSGRGLIEWLIGQRGRSIDAYVDNVSSDIVAPLLADLIGDLIARREPLEGIYHVGGPPVTKYDLLTEAARALNLDVRIVATRPGAIDRSLDSSAFFDAVGRTVPSLPAMMRALAERSAETFCGPVPQPLVQRADVS